MLHVEPDAVRGGRAVAGVTTPTVNGRPFAEPIVAGGNLQLRASAKIGTVVSRA